MLKWLKCLLGRHSWVYGSYTVKGEAGRYKKCVRCHHSKVESVESDDIYLGI